MCSGYALKNVLYYGDVRFDLNQFGRWYGLVQLGCLDFDLVLVLGVIILEGVSKLWLDCDTNTPWRG